MQACVREALRLHPVMLPVRMAGKGATIAGKSVPEGTGVHACTYAMHTDPRIWPEPDDYRPQRFIDGLSPEADAAQDSLIHTCDAPGSYPVFIQCHHVCTWVTMHACVYTGNHGQWQRSCAGPMQCRLG